MTTRCNRGPMAWAFCFVTMLSGCPDAPPAPATIGSAASASGSAALMGSAPVSKRPPHPAMGPGPQPRPPAKPVASASLTQHLAGSGRLRIWEVKPRPDAGPKLGAVLVTDRKLIKAMKAAIGFDQKPAPPKEKCKRCASPVRFVFESPLGMDFGGIDLGCEGDPKGTGRYWQPASEKCGVIKIAKPAELAKLIAQAKKKPAKPPMQGQLP